MTAAELMALALAEMRKSSISDKTWANRIQNGYKGQRYKYEETHIWAALEAMRQAAALTTPPPPSAPTGFGSAGTLSGRGIMLGSNPDVWDQALTLARGGFLETVAVIPLTPQPTRQLFTEAGLKVHVWYPPELLGPRAGNIEQAEGQVEWNNATTHNPTAVALNSWTYGRFPIGCVALVEAYYNEGWGVNFEEYKNYMPQGARGVIPLCGGYSATGRTDAASAALYQQLATWGPGFPGFWMYAGESLVTPLSVEVLKAWKP